VRGPAEARDGVFCSARQRGQGAVSMINMMAFVVRLPACALRDAAHLVLRSRLRLTLVWLGDVYHELLLFGGVCVTAGPSTKLFTWGGGGDVGGLEVSAVVFKLLRV
jgi:hypothetical protein